MPVARTLIRDERGQGGIGLYVIPLILTSFQQPLEGSRMPRCSCQRTTSVEWSQTLKEAPRRQPLRHTDKPKDERNGFEKLTVEMDEPVGRRRATNPR
jgi:hypothetical protein